MAAFTKNLALFSETIRTNWFSGVAGSTENSVQLAWKEVIGGFGFAPGMQTVTVIDEGK